LECGTLWIGCGDSERKDVKMLKAFKTWIEGISWKDKMRHDEVLERIEEKLCVICTISRRK